MVKVGIYGEYNVGFDTSYLRICSLHCRVCKWWRKSLWFMVNTAQDLIRRTYALAAYTVVSASGSINRQKPTEDVTESGTLRSSPARPVSGLYLSMNQLVDAVK